MSVQLRSEHQAKRLRRENDKKLGLCMRWKQRHAPLFDVYGRDVVGRARQVDSKDFMVGGHRLRHRCGRPCAGPPRPLACGFCGSQAQCLRRSAFLSGRPEAQLFSNRPRNTELLPSTGFQAARIHKPRARLDNCSPVCLRALSANAHLPAANHTLPNMDVIRSWPPVTRYVCSFSPVLCSN